MYTILTVNENEYKCRLSIKNLITVEKALGCSPLEILFALDRNEMPKMNDLLIVLHNSLTEYQHGLRLDDSMEILQNYLSEENHTIFSLITEVFVPVFKDAGLLAKDDNAKN